MILLMAIRVMQAILSVGCTKRGRRTGHGETDAPPRRAAGLGSQLTFDGALMEEEAAAAAALWVLSDLLAVCSSANTPILRSRS